MKKIVLLIAVLGIFLFSSCIKEYNQINSFTCIIDGEKLTPKGMWTLTHSTTGLYARLDSEGYFHIGASNLSDDWGDSIHFEFPNLPNEGQYSIAESNGLFGLEGPDLPHARVYKRYTGHPSKMYYSTGENGKIVIDYLNTSNQQISGIFYFSAYNKDNPSEIIEISAGNFDIIYETELD